MDPRQAASIPPFEASCDERYLFDCMPNLLADGRFKVHIVIRHVKTGKVVAFMQPDFQPMNSAGEAASVAFDLCCVWVRHRDTMAALAKT